MVLPCHASWVLQLFVNFCNSLCALISSSIKWQVISTSSHSISCFSLAYVALLCASSLSYCNCWIVCKICCIIGSQDLWMLWWNQAKLSNDSFVELGKDIPGTTVGAKWSCLRIFESLVQSLIIFYLLEWSSSFLYY